jgi:hypothetical protein
MLIEAGSQSWGSELFYQRHWRLWLWPLPPLDSFEFVIGWQHGDPHNFHPTRRKRSRPRGRAGPAALAVMAAPVTLGYGPLVSGWPCAAAVPAPLRSTLTQVKRNHRFHSIRAIHIRHVKRCLDPLVNSSISRGQIPRLPAVSILDVISRILHRGLTRPERRWLKRAIPPPSVRIYDIGPKGPNIEP